MHFEKMPVLRGDEEINPKDFLTIRAVLAIFERNAALELCKKLILLSTISVLLSLTLVAAIAGGIWTLAHPERQEVRRVPVVDGKSTQSQQYATNNQPDAHYFFSGKYCAATKTAKPIANRVM